MFKYITKLIILEGVKIFSFRKSIFLSLILIILFSRFLNVEGLLREEVSTLSMSSSTLFSDVISSLSDKAGDTPSQYQYIDVVNADVRQINLDTLQFEMKVKSPIPPDPGNGVVVYLWIIDTDMNPDTGQRHVFVGSEYNVRVTFYDGHWQGWVDITPEGGQKTGGGPCPVFIDNDTVSILVKRSQIGNASSFSWEVSASDDRGGFDGADTYAVAHILSEVPSTGVALNVLLSPSQLVLAKGETAGKLTVTVRGQSGERLPFSTVKFFADYPSLVNITPSGEVYALPGKVGHCWITAKVDGIMSSNHVEVTVGSMFLLPPILLLSLDSPIGKLSVEAYDAYGNRVTPRTVEYSSSSPSVATVDNNGVVTAIRPPKTFGETPIISAKIDGVLVPNVVVVRVTQDNLGLAMKALPGKHVVFYIPEQPIQGYDYQKIFSDYDVVRITDIAYELESEATGVVPYGGSTLFLVNDPGHDDGTVPCGLSGNPIRLGSSVDKPASCMISCGGTGFPAWFVYFHEMGHDFTLEGVKPAQFFFGGANHTVVYVEGLATALAMYVAKMIKERASIYNISSNIVNNVITLWHFGSTPSLDQYVKNGAHYDQMNPDVLDEMIDVIGTKYGYDSLYRFYSLFLPRDVPFSFTIDTDAKQATVFVAALSAATGADLRAQFREWGFPIDDEFYARIWDEVNWLVNQRVTNYLIVARGTDNGIYFAVYNDTSKLSWSKLPGMTSNAPSTTLSKCYEDRAYIVVRGMDSGIYFGYLDLKTQKFTGWSRLPGNTPSRPMIISGRDVGLDCKIFLVVRGTDNRIYFNIYDELNSNWTGWKTIPTGITIDAPSVSLVNEKLHIVVRGSDGSSLWYGYLNIDKLTFSGWKYLPGQSPSQPFMTSDGLNIWLVVRGMDNKVYLASTRTGNDWSEWKGIYTGDTLEAPVLEIADYQHLHLLVIGSDSLSIWYTKLLQDGTQVLPWSKLPGLSPSPLAFVQLP
jgi:hypothetical protein